MLLLVLALTPYTGDPAGPVKYLITGWAVALLAGWGCLAVLFSSERPALIWPLWALLGSFLFVYLAAAVLSEFPMFALSRVCTWILLSLVALIAAQHYRQPEQAWRLLFVMVGAVAVSSVYGFCQAAGWDPFPWAQTKVEEYRGLPSTYANPNFAGHVLVLAIPMALGGLFHVSGRASGRKGDTVSALRRWVPSGLLLGALMILVIHLYFTRMRGGWIGLTGALVLLGLFSALRWAKMPALRAAVISCAALGALALCGFLVVLAGVSAAYRDKPLPIDGSLTLRLNGYYGASRMILDKPILGYGPGNYELCNIPYWTAFEKQWFASERKKNNHVHCDLLEAGVDAGFPGAALYLALLAYGLLGALSLAGSEDSNRRGLGYVLAACFAAFAVDGQLGFNMRVPVSSVLFFVLLGVTASLTSGQAAKPRAFPLAQGLLFIAALIVAIMVSRQFYGEFMLQRGKGGMYWANEYRKQGDANRETRTLRDASAYTERGRRFMPWDVRFPELEGQFALRLRNLEESIAFFKQALRLHPHHPDVMISLSQSYLNLSLRKMAGGPEASPKDEADFRECLEAARRYAEEALKLCDVHPEVYEALGRVAFARGAAQAKSGGDGTEEWRQAEAAFEKSLHYGGRDRALLQRMLGQAALNAKDYAAAEKALRASAESEPANEETWQLFYRLAQEQKHSTAFFDMLSYSLGRLKRQAPVPLRAIAAVSVYLADIYATERNAPDLARGILSDALELDASQLALWGAYVSLLPKESRLAELQQALTVFAARPGASLPGALEALRRLEPENAASLLTAARAAAEGARVSLSESTPENAVKEYRWIANLLLDQLDRAGLPAADQGAVLAAVGAVYAAGARWEEADRVYARAQSLLPETEQVTLLIQRSESLAGMKRPEEALTFALEAARIEPSSPQVRWNAARRLAEAGRLKEAKFEYVSLLGEIGGNSPARAKVQSEYQALLQRLGERAEGAPR